MLLLNRTVQIGVHISGCVFTISVLPKQHGADCIAKQGSLHERTQGLTQGLQKEQAKAIHVREVAISVLEFRCKTGLIASIGMSTVLTFSLCDVTRLRACFHRIPPYSD